MSLIVSHSIIAGTEWIRHDPAAWWAPGERGTKPRAPLIDLLIGHWTGGEGARDHAKHGPVVVTRMKARRRPDGSPMEVGIHFVIGACEPEDDYAPVWQTADPGLTATIHAGRAVNARSIGVEVVSAGLHGKADVRARPELRVPLIGSMRRVLAFYPGQLRSWQRLANTLADLPASSGIRIPCRVPAFGASRRFSPREQRAWSGAQEHCHVPTTTKLDAGGLLVDALADCGWRRE